MTGDFDCQACGACCRFGGEVLVARTEAVPLGLTRSVRGMVGPAALDAGVRRMRRAPDNRCIALRGEIGQACGCGIYERRPKGCREFEAGSLPCLGCRSAVGL